MTITLADRPPSTSEMSVVDHTFEGEREVNPMSTAVLNTPSVLADSSVLTGHARPTGLDRAVMLLSLAMLRWAQRHADRALLPYEEFSRHNRNARDREAREQAWATSMHRIF